MKKKLWLNGKIYTVDEKLKWAEAIVTEGNKIVFVGSNKEAKSFAGNEYEEYDFQNKLVLPGFIDSHVHFMIGGLSLRKLDLGNVKSKEQFRKEVEEYSKSNSAEWILGGNWNHLQFDVKVLPSKEWLDDLTNKPIYLTRVDIHTALVNSAALKIAGINRDTPDPEGGQILRDSNGEPTGILKDTAMKLVANLIPPPTEEEYYDALLAAQKKALRNGITSVHDITEKKYYNIYEEFHNRKKLRTRINCIHLINEIDDIGYQNIVARNNGDEFLKSGSLKAFADGSLGSNTAWFFEPYNDDPTTTGLPTDYMTNGQFKKWAVLADMNKIQLVVHAIGDRAISEVLDVFEEIVEINPKWERRFRIEHVQHIKRKDIERMKKLNVIASMQPSQLYDDGVWAEEKIGKERLKGTHAVKSLLDNEIKVCLGSDWTVTPLNVIHGIDIAVNRKTKDGANPGGWIPEEKISVEQAVNAYTLDAAYASFEENTKGSIEVGKLADFAVLSENILEIPSEEIQNVKVVNTIFDGEYEGQF